MENYSQEQMAVSISRSRRAAELQLTKPWREQRDISPERNKVWTEPQNGKLKSDRRVPVLYYLSRNGQLEHPHFMEVPLSSPQGLFLRDVINRLNDLRGKGMAAMYSWSCKRSYKNGFVWHDLSENDFIYPAHGHEYVLKGSELHDNAFVASSPRQNPPPALVPPPGAQTATGDNLHLARAAARRMRHQSCSSIDFSLHEYSVYKAECPEGSAAADASTQTDDMRRRRRQTSTEITEEEKGNETPGDEIEISPPPSDSSPETLEKLMKADGRLTLRPETVNENPPSTDSHHHHIQRCKSSVLMQLISCGSIPFKNCGAAAGQVVGLMSQYRVRLPRGGGTAENGGRRKVEEKEYFSGSIVETKKEEFPALKRSTSYNADWSCSHLEHQVKEMEGVTAKCIPRKPRGSSILR